MRASFNNFPIIIFLVTVLASPSSAEITSCPYDLSVVLEKNHTIHFENGSAFHEGILYPPESYWKVDNTTYGCPCRMPKLCLQKCCGHKENLVEDGERQVCRKVHEDVIIPDLKLEEEYMANDIKVLRALTERFFLLNNRLSKCSGVRLKLEPENYEDDKFVLQANGSLHYRDSMLSQSRFCVDWNETLDKSLVIVCHLPEAEPVEAETHVYPIGMIVSIPFLLATFLVYAIISELRNLYGKTLMCYVGCLIIAYSFLSYAIFHYTQRILCTVLAFIIHFSFLSSFFWLNVMCFDIWWTFGGFRSLQGSAKQRDRKKFTLYSIYAWGSASFITGICILMDYLPNIPKNFIKPEFGVESCWFNTDAARAIYFYGPMGVTVFCNICLFISTAVKIGQHKKDTAHHLKSSESRRHDDNKQWFNLYLKLFIVMGINWSMEIISWLCKGPQYVWYITDLPNSLQGLIIFIIFVWKDKIRRLLLKRFGCHERNFLSRNSTRSVYNSSAASRTCTTSAPLQEKTNPFVNENNRSKVISEESDCA